MNRRKALLTAAAVVAILGTLLVVAYVRSASSRAADQYHAVKVLKVVKQINQGETVAQAQSDGSIVLGDVAANSVVQGALTDLSKISTDVALTTLYPGEQIVDGKFGASSASAALSIPPGMVAISVSFTDQTRVASFVNPGNAVAVFLNGNQGNTYSRLLLPKVQVIAVGSTSTLAQQANKAQTSTNLPSTLITFAVTQRDAQKIFFAQTQGTLSLALLNGASKVAPDPGINTANLFN